MEKIETGKQRTAKHDDGGTLSIVSEKDAIEELIGMADNVGADTVFCRARARWARSSLWDSGA